MEIKRRKKHLTFGALFEVEMLKKHTPLWRDARLEVNMPKTSHSKHFWKLRCPKKCTQLWQEARLEVKMRKTHHVRTTFARSSVALCGRHIGFCTFLKMSQTCVCFVLFCIIFKNSGRCGTFEELCKDAFRMAGAVQETSSSDMLGGYGMLRRCFPEKGCILEHQIFRFAKMFLRDMTWPHFFMGWAIL